MKTENLWFWNKNAVIGKIQEKNEAFHERVKKNKKELQEKQIKQQCIQSEIKKHNDAVKHGHLVSEYKRTSISLYKDDVNIRKRIKKCSKQVDKEITVLEEKLNSGGRRTDQDKKRHATQHREFQELKKDCMKLGNAFKFLHFDWVENNMKSSDFNSNECDQLSDNKVL